MKESFRHFVVNSGQNEYPELREYNLSLLSALQQGLQPSEDFEEPHQSPLQTVEIVFSRVHPRNTVPFLVSFLLRHGTYETELDLFRSNNLLSCYKYGKLLPQLLCYDETHLLLLLKLCLTEELVFSPGGSQTFSWKLQHAKEAFSILLNMTDVSSLSAPVVLVAEIQDKVANEVSEFLLSSQISLFDSLSRLGLLNLPASLDDLSLDEIRQPILRVSSAQSRFEQNRVLDSLYRAVDGVLSGRATEGRTQMNHVLLGNI